MTQTGVKVVFGAMTFGKPGVEQTRVHDLKDAGAMLDVFQKHGHDEVDTARVYGGGSSEEYLGQLDWQGRKLKMETKYYSGARFAGSDAPTTQSAADLRKHLMMSLEALKAKKLDIWYMHNPDRTRPYEETMAAINELYKEGLFDRFGISNYPAWEVAYINEICIKNGWVRPTVYQGIYNTIARHVEAELFPCLRHYGMSYYAFSPLAGGYLTSRYHRDSSTVEAGSRFDPNTRQGQLYRMRYWQDAMFDALEIIRPVAAKHSLTEAECALRWMVHHSKLSKEYGDAIIIGASSAKSLEENLTDLEKGPLPEEVLEALDKAAAVTKGSLTSYFQ